MRLDAINLKQSILWVRIKNSLSTQQPITGDELRAIKRYLATRTDKLPWLFAPGGNGAHSLGGFEHVCCLDLPGDHPAAEFDLPPRVLKGSPAC